MSASCPGEDHVPRLPVFVVALLIAGSALAGPKEDALAKRKEGDKLLARGEYEAALASYEAGQAIFADASFYLSRASALLKLRRYEEVKAAYQGYLASGKAGTRQREVEKAIRELEGILSTTLACDSTPTGAVVFLDSRIEAPLGQAPLRVNLPPGRHRVYFEKEGFLVYEAEIEVREGEEHTLSASLQVAPAQVEVSSDPPAELLIDGAPRGTTPLAVEIAPGSYELLLRAPKRADARRAVVLAPGESLRWEETLAPSPTGLALALSPAGARLRVEGQAEVLASGVHALPPGDYRGTVEAPGYRAAPVSFTVREGELASVEATLTPQLARLLLRTRPDGARVTLNGAPLQGETLAPGAYTLRVEAPGYSPYEMELTLAAEQSATAEVILAAEDKAGPRLRAALYASAGATVLAGTAAAIGDTRFVKGERDRRPFAAAIVCDLGLVATGTLWWLERRHRTQDGAPRRSTATLEITLPPEEP